MTPKHQLTAIETCFERAHTPEKKAMDKSHNRVHQKQFTKTPALGGKKRDKARNAEGTRARLNTTYRQKRRKKETPGNSFAGRQRRNTKSSNGPLIEVGLDMPTLGERRAAGPAAGQKE